ncbi:MAG: hypothetical protein N3I35_16500 [Clostridia bacterium]|nr:hypothetical protein [Clostridia bacterium]
MSTKAVYPYFREIYPGAAANCFTGSLCEVMRLTGSEIQEYIIYLLGNGFRFYAAIDDFGDPKLFTELTKTVDIFCEKYGVGLNYKDIDQINTKKQILNVLENEHIIVWLNSKHLKYSDFYYSQEEGYLHAIAIEREINPGLVRIIDSLIVSAPVVNCIADFELEYLEKALLDKIEKPEITNVTKKIITLSRRESMPTSLENTILRSSLYSNSAEILKDYCKEKKSPVMEFCRYCQEALEEGNEKRKVWLLQRINRIIKTLWVIPNRKLLHAIIPDLNLAKYEEDTLVNSLDDMINNWLVLSSCCLKCSVQIRKVDMLEEYFIDADKGEESFWRQVSDTLKKYV